MDAKLIVKELITKTGTSQEKLAKACGMAAQTNVTGILNRGTSLRVDKLEQLISAMGYKIMIVPSEVKAEQDWYDVTTGGSKE